MTDMHVNEPLLNQIIKIQGSQALKISNLDNKIDGVEKGVTKILFYIENDEKTGTKGVVSKQKDMSKRLSFIENELENQKIKDKTQKKILAGIVAFSTAIGGLIAKYI
jgi:hypothetical protein